MLFTPALVTTAGVEIRPSLASARKVDSFVPTVDCESIGLLYFAFAELIAPSDSAILKATLVLTVMGRAGEAGEVSVGTILTPWIDAADVSWLSPWAGPGMEPDADYEPERRVPAVSPDDGSFVQVAIDVTDDLQRWLGGRLSNQGWCVSSDLQLGSTNNRIRAAQPLVVVKYSEGESAVQGAGVSSGGI